jgi:hypothetical protein
LKTLGNKPFFGKNAKAIALIGLVLASGLASGITLGAMPMASAAPACATMSIAGASASDYEAVNPPKNAIDNNSRTRWSSEGFGSWIRADLGGQQTVCSVDITWYKGNARSNSFAIAVSSDGSSYKNVYNGESSGTTTSSERYSFTETNARYVRITVTDVDGGNGEWVSVSEIDVNGYTPVAPTAPTTDTTAPAIKITQPAADSDVVINNGQIVVSGTSSDSGSGVKAVGVRVDSGSYVSATPKAAGDWSTWSINLPITLDEHRLVSRATDGAGNQAWNSIYVTVTNLAPSGGTGSGGGSEGGTLDNFGIEKIYPTADGGNEWYVNMADPYSDPLLQNRETLTKQSDGSWQVSGGSNGQVRLEAWSPVNEKWLNVEITMYAKMVSGSNELLQLYSRGGHHTSSNECLGSAVKARLYGDGEARWVKEINHPAYTSNRGSVDATDDPLKGRWVGFKAVIYNFVENGNTYVRMESYIDDDVTDSNGNLVIDNDWQLASVVEDRGGWATNDSDFNSSCAPLNKDSDEQYRQRDEILNMPGGTSTQNIAAFRSDGLTWNWKYLSVREIDPTA